ncbi:multidrug transporter [Ureibacillus aquaedulcis]|uniref:Multidrug transporter n=1 Tax=Ureibacillus aquaedulcis TaxID=3058421 RepID=A0ABT8GPX3_9BACL|nr:multidrug transporter [Ureibacillus sp. BA0131]MDN4492971.1 multidrug transporter [Ureibacillus sp. BA0131]
MDKNKTSVPQLDTNLKNYPEANDNEKRLNIKETIAKNKEIIEKNREMLRKYQITNPLKWLLY